MLNFENELCDRREARYVCPFCGGDVYGGERVYSPDGVSFVCEECAVEYIGDLSADELCKLFGMDSVAVEEM